MQNILRRPGRCVSSGGWVFKVFAAASALLALLVLLCPCQLRAQLATADVVGTVIDTTGAVVPNAKVTLLNTGTGIASAMNTNNLGEYQFSKVQVGTFKITVEAKGFKSFTVTDLALTVGQRARIDAALVVGSQVETVQVEASAAAVLQTDSSDINAVMSTTTLDDMPTNGRNYYSLIGLQPGTSQSGASGNPSDMRPIMTFSANGQSALYNNNMIDGMDNNMQTFGTVAVEPSLDALQEVQVETSNYSAEYSRTGGGIANLITKSGTNHLHGSAFEFMRNNDFDAYGWEPSGTPKSISELRQNQFGGSLGGPILKNKAFFFGDYQGWRKISSGTSKTNSLVPNEAEYQSIQQYVKGGGTGSIVINDQFQSSHAGDANGNITIPASQVSPLGLAILLSMPEPGGCTLQSNGLCGPTYNYSAWAKTVQNANTYDGRVDYHFNDRNTLFARLSHNETNTTQPSGLPQENILPGNSQTWANVSLNPIGQNDLAFDYVHIFSPKTLFEAKAGYLRANQDSQSAGASTDWMSLLGYQCSTEYCYTLKGMPMLQGQHTVGTFGDASTQANYSFNGDNPGTFFIENTFQYSASLTLNRKSHSIKTGVALIRRQIEGQLSSGMFLYSSANYTGNVLADELEGLYVGLNGDVTMAMHRGRTWTPSAYIQDDWRATKALTLNLGVRYDIYAPMTDRDGNISNFDPNTDLVVSPNLLGPNKSGPTGNVVTDFGDVAPRIGFAYTLGNSGWLKDMVLRGGFGLSYYPSNSGMQAGTFQYLLVNAPYIWATACNAPGYGNQASCGPGGNNYPTALPDGGYQLTTAGSYPRPTYDSTLATNPNNYASSLQSSTFVMPNFKPGYLEQFNLQLQKQIGNNIVTAGFVGNLGRRQSSMQNINQPISGANNSAGIFPLATQAAPWMSHVTLAEQISGGNSKWEAGEFTYERRLSAGLSANVNYTWSRTGAQGTGVSECPDAGCPMDNGSGTAVLLNGWTQYNYTGSTSNVLAGMVSYNVPFGKSLHGIAGAAAKGWGLNGTGSWQTGPWQQVTSSQDGSGLLNATTIGMGAKGSEFPNKVPGVSWKPQNQSLSNWINPNAFALQTSGLLGNAKFNDVQGPRVRDADLSLGKTFSLAEGFKLQFRADAFNFTNTVSLSLGSSGGGPPPPPGGGGGGGGGSTAGISNYCPKGTTYVSGAGPGQPSSCSDGSAPNQPGDVAIPNSGSFGIITSTAGSYGPRIFQFGLKLIY